MKMCSIASGSSGNCIFIGTDEASFLVDAGISGKRVIQGVESLDRRMEELPSVGLLKVRDAEPNEERWIDTSSKIVRRMHHESWTKRKEQLNDIFTKSNVDNVSVRTDQDYVKALMALFAKRN